MCTRYVGFVLLVWFPGALHAQSAARHCPAPKLVGGYFVPVKETYSHDSQLTYACENTYKPAVAGWWATSVCQNGTWSHKPQCIDEKACILPTAANGQYTYASDGWLEEESVIRITCDKGYEHKNNMATAKCVNGTWSSLPICEKSIRTCNTPLKIAHAVIVHQGYQELFLEDSTVQYECKTGYRMEGSYKNPLVCLAGTWTEYPTCSKVTVGGDPTSTGRGTQPGSGGGGGSRTDRGHGGSVEVGTSGGHSTSSGRGTQPGSGGGGGSRTDRGHGGSVEVGTSGGHSTSSGQGTQPGSGGDSSTSDSLPSFIPINNCGTWPVVTNAVVVHQDRMFLKFKCNSFYTQDGPENVVCYSDGSWSPLPICKDAFCVLTPGIYTHGLELSVTQFVKEGELIYIRCTWPDYSVALQCTNRRITYTHCCTNYDHNRSVCRIVRQNFLPGGSHVKK